MLATHAVGIDLGTTYSCIAYLNEHGEPVTISNPDGEQCTPSAVFFDDQGEEIVGTEALRHTVIHPDRVIQNAKRYMGDAKKVWTVDGTDYTPTQISSIILKHLLTMASAQIGPIQQAVITVPAQFSDAQRQATIEAGKLAGLKRVDIINEPVAASLCYVLGTEGLWFSELAQEQRILVYDLGGGTFDLSLVSYKQDEVKVIASTGDLHLGGIDWNQAVLNSIAGRFKKDTGADPTQDPESLQHLALEVEQAKRSLTVREKTGLVVQHSGQRKTYTLTRDEFNQLTQPLLLRTRKITEELVKGHLRGWAQVDVVLTTGGSSRMQMVKDMLKGLSGRTLNTSLSPDQSISHGATYYAGMIISKSEFVKSILSEAVSTRLKKVQQHSVTARGLGILVRDSASNSRVPHYLIQANTPLPASATQTFGTVSDNQKRVHLYIVESGERSDLPYVQLGNCIIENLPPNLPRDSEIAVTISYDASARVHVSAKDVSSGKEARTEIIRTENLVEKEIEQDEDVLLEVESDPKETIGGTAGATMVKNPAAKNPAPAAPSKPAPAGGPPAAGRGALGAARPAPTPKPAAKPAPQPINLEESNEMPVALCETCGEALNALGFCDSCEATLKPRASAPKPAASPRPMARPVPAPQPSAGRPAPVAKPAPPAKASPPVKAAPPKPNIKAAPPPPAIKPAASTTKPAAPKPPSAPPAKPPSVPHLFDDDDVIDLFEEPPAPKKPAKPPTPMKPGSKPNVKPLPPPPTGGKKPKSRSDYLDED